MVISRNGPDTTGDHRADYCGGRGTPGLGPSNQHLQISVIGIFRQPCSVVVFCPTTMSAIASFIKVPKSALEGLRNAAAGGTDHDYLSTNGREVAEYRWSGYVLVTLLPYLEEKHQIDLMKSEYDELAAFLTNTTGAIHFIFTPGQRSAFLNRLQPRSFSEEEMRQYFNEFNATNEQEIGRAMLDGVNALRESLGQIEDTSVVVFSFS
jgi:hypothetical protein